MHNIKMFSIILHVILAFKFGTQCTIKTPLVVLSGNMLSSWMSNSSGIIYGTFSILCILGHTSENEKSMWLWVSLIKQCIIKSVCRKMYVSYSSVGVIMYSTILCQSKCFLIKKKERKHSRLVNKRHQFKEKTFS